MKIEYTYGHAVLKFQDELAKCRFYSAQALASTKNPPYAAVCDIARWTSLICEVRGFKGVIERDHLRCLVEALTDRGFEAAYLERPDGQGLDTIADRIEGGDFDGWYRLNLLKLAQRLRMKPICN